MAWEVVAMQTFSDWYADLDDGAVEQVNAVVEML